MRVRSRREKSSIADTNSIAEGWCPGEPAVKVGQKQQALALRFDAYGNQANRVRRQRLSRCVILQRTVEQIDGLPVAKVVELVPLMVVQMVDSVARQNPAAN